jgi:hypothetical protein
MMQHTAVLHHLGLACLETLGYTFVNAEPEAIDFSSVSKKDTDSLSQ